MESVFSGAYEQITALLRLVAFVAGGVLIFWLVWRYSEELQSFVTAVIGYGEGLAAPLLAVLLGVIASDWVRHWVAFSWAVASVAVGIAAGLFQVDDRLQRRPGRYWYSPPDDVEAAIRRWEESRRRREDDGERRLVPNSYLEQLAAGFPYSRQRRN